MARFFINYYTGLLIFLNNSGGGNYLFKFLNTFVINLTCSSLDNLYYLIVQKP